jgi:hypothetical protein
MSETFEGVVAKAVRERLDRYLQWKAGIRDSL